MDDHKPLSIWARAARGGRGPAPRYSRDEIAATSVALADSGGLAAVSMRAVAASLGTSAGSLYRYLSSRDDLLDLMTDAVLGELAPPATRAADPDGHGDWLDELVRLAVRLLTVYRRHPWLPEALRRGPAPGPHALAYLEACLRVLAPVPAGTTAKFEAIALLAGVTALFASEPGRYQLTGADPACHPHLTAALIAAPPTDPAPDLLDRALRGLMTGLLVGKVKN